MRDKVLETMMYVEPCVHFTWTPFTDQLVYRVRHSGAKLRRVMLSEKKKRGKTFWKECWINRQKESKAIIHILLRVCRAILLFFLEPKKACSNLAANTRSFPAER